MTKREMFEKAIAILSNDNANDEIVTMMQHEIELLANRAEKAKAGAEKRKAKTAEKSQASRDAVYAVVADAENPMNVFEIVDALQGAYTKGQVVAFLTQLVKENKIVREAIKYKDAEGHTKNGSVYSAVVAD